MKPQAPRPGTETTVDPPRAGSRRWTRGALIALLLLATGFAGYRVWRQTSWNRHRSAVEEALVRRDFDGAIEELERCLELRPEDSELYLLLAQTTRRAGDFEGAARHLRRYERKGGSRESASVEGQLLRLQAGDLRTADDLARHCEEHPDAGECRLILEALIQGSLRALDIERAQSALALWEQRTSSPADEVQGLLWSGTIHELAGKIAEARADYRQAVELDPRHRTARLRLALLLFDAAPEEAEAHLETLRQDNPRDVDVLFHQARLLRIRGEAERAAEVLDALLALEPRHVGGLVERGRVELDRGDVEAAGEHLRMADEVSPKHREVLLAMIDYHRRRGDADEVARYEQRMRDVEAEIKATVEANLRRRAAALGEESAATQD